LVFAAPGNDDDNGVRSVNYGVGFSGGGETG
jgi:hypothetical protein